MHFILRQHFKIITLTINTLRENGPQKMQAFFFTRPGGILWGEKRHRLTQTFFLNWLKQLRTLEKVTKLTFCKNKVQKWWFLYLFWVEMGPPSQGSGSTDLPKPAILSPNWSGIHIFGKFALPQIIRNSAPSTPPELIFGSFESWECHLSNDAQVSVWSAHWAELWSHFDRVTIGS